MFTMLTKLLAPQIANFWLLNDFSRYFYCLPPLAEAVDKRAMYSLVPKERNGRKENSTLWVENGLNIGNRASGLDLNMKDINILLSAFKNLEIIQF